MKNIWITATPPTPNGPLHLGHLAGPYIAADAMRRSLDLAGMSATMTTGLDDNQTYVQRRAVKEGKTPAALASEFGAEICDIWASASVDFNHVEGVQDPSYVSVVQDMFLELYQAGVIQEEDAALPYCDTCDRWCYDAFLQGECPHCGVGTNGNACEKCCRPNVCVDVSNPTCVACGSAPRSRRLRLLMMDLKPFEENLTEYWASTKMPPNLGSLCGKMQQDGLPKIIVAHPGEWGIPVEGVPGFDDHRIYVWLEMAAGYRWQARGMKHPSKNIQFFGIDNGYFHSILFPAVYMALGWRELLAQEFYVNEFYLLDGAKFSTSRQHALWANPVLDSLGADAVRLHALRTRPELQQENFTWTRMDETIQMMVAWNATLMRLIGAEESDKALGPGGVFCPETEAEDIRKGLAEAVKHLRPEFFNPKAYVRVMDAMFMRLASFGDRKNQISEPLLKSVISTTSNALSLGAPNASRILNEYIETGVKPVRILGNGRAER